MFGFVSFRSTVFASAVLIFALGVWVTLRSFPDGDRAVPRGDGDWDDAFTIEQLVATSDRVVLATLLSSEDFDVAYPSPVNAQARAVVNERRLTFSVDETLKGDAIDGELMDVVRTLGSSRTGANERTDVYESPSLRVGNTYVLFVQRADVPPEYPRSLGEVVWVRSGEPWIATLAHSGLEFLVSERYRDAAAERGANLGSAALLETGVSVDEVRGVVATHTNLATPERSGAASYERGAALAALVALLPGLTSQSELDDAMKKLDLVDDVANDPPFCLKVSALIRDQAAAQLALICAP